MSQRYRSFKSFTAEVEALETTSEKPTLDPTQWLDSHGDYLYRYALVRVRDAAVAEDLLQETLLAAIGAGGSHEGRSSERTWLAGIMKHKIYDYFRRAARAPELPLSTDNQEQELDMFENSGAWLGHWREDCAPLSWPKDVVRMLESREFWETFDRCLSRLPRQMAIAFTLREIDGMSTNQICEILNVSPNNLWVVLHRGRAKLRQLLEAEWFRNSNRAPLANTKNPERLDDMSVDPKFSYRAVAA